MATEMENTEVEGTLAEALQRLGDVPPERIRMRPAPGTATEKDVLVARESPQKRLCELVDGVLVEKTMGTYEALLAGLILTELWIYLRKNHLGQALGADGMLRVMPGLVRIPDVSFIAWEHWPTGVGPRKIAAAAPDLAVEVLSPKNTRQEIQRKLREYFLAGTRLAWVLQPKKQTAEVYTSPEDVRRVAKNGTLDGGAVLPGFKVSLKALFAEANRPPKRH